MDVTLTSLTMPKLGLTMTEGVITEWRAAQGARVQQGDIVFVVETDKIATEIEAPSDGEIVEILFGEGATVPVGEAVARWTGIGMAGDAETADASASSEPEPKAPDAPADSQDSAGKTAKPLRKRVPATPLARRLAEEWGTDLATVTGTGPRGRIKAEDVRRHHEAAKPAANPGGDAPRQEPRVEPVPALQQTAARRVLEAKTTIPHFYVSREAEISELTAFRRQLTELTGQKISLNDCIVVAFARALNDLPECNRVWRDGEYVSYPTTDIGIAVQTERGLLVPVVRDLGLLPLDQAARHIGAVLSRARDGNFTADDLTGGTASVSNVGMFGATSLTPIVNPGQSSILGVGDMREVFRPDADGNPELRRELSLVLAADHRVLDGVDGARILAGITHYLENPLLLMATPMQGQTHVAS